MIEKIIETWENCEGDKSKQGAFVLLCLLTVAIITTIIYFYWWIVLLIGAGILHLVVEEQKRRREIEFQKQQKLNNHKRSVISAVREGFTGLEDKFGLPPTKKGKGFSKAIVRYFKDGVLYFDLFYSRLPNLPDFIPEECEQYKKILNDEVQSNYEDITDENVEPLFVYVSKLQTKNGKLSIRVIPLIDDKSRTIIERFQCIADENAVIGKTEDDKTKIGHEKVLVDDEV